MRATDFRELLDSPPSLTPRQRDELASALRSGQTGCAIGRLNHARQDRMRDVFHIQNVNSYHSRWKEWMRRFRGVSTLYHRNYLAWFRTLDTRPTTAPPNFMLHQMMPA